MPSPMKTTADRALRQHGATLDEWLTDRLREGATHEGAARKLEQDTGGLVVVSHVAMGRWLREAREGAEAA